MATVFTPVLGGADFNLLAVTEGRFSGYFVVINSGVSRAIFSRVTSLRKAKKLVRFLLGGGVLSSSVGVAVYWLPRSVPRLVYAISGLRISGAP